jgi:murein DD-endopeptidase MepM/ murein hydrolase activator NlpD
LTSTLTARSQTLFDQAAQFLAQHPKRTTAAIAVIAALLIGGTGGALALASLAPDASTIPVRLVIEPVSTALDRNPTNETTALPPLNLYRSDITRSSDTADTLLKRLGIDDVQAANFLRNDTLVRQQLLGRGGRNVKAEADAAQGLLRLSARWSPDDNGQFKRLVIEKADQGFTSRLESAPLNASARLASGSIRSSLFAATDDAGLPDAVATQMAEIFSSDIDFRRALRKDDHFNVVYEVLEGDGEPMRTGRVLSAEFVNAGKTFQAMWFQPPGHDAQDMAHKGGYYTLDGQSKRRAFLSSPVAFSRISSGFAMRFHPVLQKWRQHLGTDFAAATGTPARTVGDGVVSFAGWQNGYGNVIFVKHRNNTDTVYAHLSKLLVQRGENVAQGQSIGLIGSTGWATGPHLHFEVRVGGVQHDPMAMARQSETVPVPTVALPLFMQTAALVKTELQAAASISQTRFQ